MQKNSFLPYLACFAALFLPMLFAQNAYADVAISFGTASKNLMEPISLFTSAVYNTCYVVGIALFASSIAHYHAHRLAPNNIPLSRPIMVLFLAIAIALLPIVARLSEASKLINA